MALYPTWHVGYAANMSQHANGQSADMSGSTRVTVEEAAKLLGLSGNAVRKRLERGTLQSVKVDGIRYVVLDGDMSQHANDTPNDMSGDMSLMQAHLDSMREQIGYLKDVIEKRDEEMRRKDHLLAAALERIPAIEEAPPEPREAPEPGADIKPGVDPQGEDAGPETGVSRRSSWWRRLFSG
jgi:excisionase family DNA binding protein